MNLTNLENIISGLKSFSALDEVSKILDDNADALVNLERDQLSKGLDIAGNPRDDQYHPFTIQEKERIGKGIGAITDHVTFFMTGNLYSQLHYETEGSFYDKNFTFVAPLETYDKMIDRIGENNYGLSPANRLIFAEGTLLPAFAQVFEEKTGLKL